MTNTVSDLEERRIAIQAELDAAKNQAERNQLGQFATPTGLAAEVLRYAEEQLDEATRIRFLDPALGTGSFYSALGEVFPKERLAHAVGYEIDPHYGLAAAKLWSGSSLDVRLDDFTRVTPPMDSERFNLLICNPPYVRHHHIPNGDKARLKELVWKACGIEIDGLAGLYCYFLCLSHAWMAQGGLAGWLIPSEFMDVKYGASVKSYLLDRVTLTHIHRFDPNEVQFGDALVSSSVVWFRNESPRRDHQVRMTYGGSLLRPKLERLVPVRTLGHDRKWTKYSMNEIRQEPNAPVLSDFFNIKRGLATGSNPYFILSAEEIEDRDLPLETFRPILPSPRYVPEDEIESDELGNPVLNRRLFLLDCRLPEGEIEKRFPALMAYLEEGKEHGVADRYLCRHRKVWYAQEHRPEAPLLCTYMGRNDNKRGRPFRFILNHSRATASNVYLMLYPKEPLSWLMREQPELKQRVWETLNEIRPQAMLGEGRVYGGGLHKLEPKELGNVPAVALAELLQEMGLQQEQQQLALFQLV